MNDRVPGLGRRNRGSFPGDQAMVVAGLFNAPDWLIGGGSRAGKCLILGLATGLEVALAAFSPLLDLLADVPDPRRAAGKLYGLPHVLLFSILAIVAGCNSYRGIVTFIDVHRRRLNAACGLTWRRAPAHTAVRTILQGLDPAAVEAAFRRHAALLQAARATPGQGSVALDGKTLPGRFDRFHDRAAAQVLSAFATGTALVLAHADIAAKSNETPAAQALLAEQGRHRPWHPRHARRAALPKKRLRLRRKPASP